MNPIEVPFEKPARTYIVWDEAREGRAGVGVINKGNGHLCGGLTVIFNKINDNSTECSLFIEAANSVDIETLIRAAEIVHYFMTAITAEALEIALMIADTTVSGNNLKLHENSLQHLHHRVTVTAVRKFLEGRKNDLEINHIRACFIRHGVIASK